MPDPQSRPIPRDPTPPSDAVRKHIDARDAAAEADVAAEVERDETGVDPDEDVARPHPAPEPPD